MAAGATYFGRNLTSDLSHALTVPGFLVHDLCQSLLVALIVSLTGLASICIQMITEDVQKYLGSYNVVVGDQVVKWMQTYHLILNFVESFNHVFGPVLFIFFSEWSFFFIIYSFHVVLGIYENSPSVSLSIVFLLYMVFLMLILIIGAENMKIKVRTKQKKNKKTFE